MAPGAVTPTTLGEQEARAIADFQRHFHVTFHDPDLLKLALTHRSYLSVTGQGPRESNERLEFLGDSVLGLVTSEFLYRRHPNEHEGQLTKIKSLLVSKAILSRRALAMGLGRFVLMSHSEVESGGRQRLSILADAFESVLGAIYLDQGFEAGRAFIEHHLLRDTLEITQDKRHTNYKSHLQEYVQSTWRTHPVYRIRSEVGPDHSKHFLVEVLVGKRALGEGRGRNKKEAEQAAARDALERARPDRSGRNDDDDERGRPEPRRERAEERPRTRPETPRGASPAVVEDESEPLEERGGRRRGRRGGRGRGLSEGPRGESRAESRPGEAVEREREPAPALRRPRVDFDEVEEVGRPEGPLEERHIDPYAYDPEPEEDDDFDDAPAAHEPLPDDDDEDEPESAPPSRAAAWEPAPEPERHGGRDTSPAPPEPMHPGPAAAGEPPRFGRRGRRAR